MRTASPPTPRRRRPHPAQRARRIAGTMSVAAMVLLTGCMAVAGKTAGTTSATTGTTGSTTTATTPATTYWDDTTTPTTTTSRSISAGATAGVTSPQSDTSTSAS